MISLKIFKIYFILVVFEGKKNYNKIVQQHLYCLAEMQSNTMH